VLTGNYADYEVTTAGAVTTVVDRRANPVEGTATLRNVETLRFADQQVAIVLDLPPVGIALSKASVLETAAIGTVVGVVTASDPEGGPLTYALGGAAADLFEMVGNEIRVKSGLDFETAESHDLKVTVTDEAGNSASKTFVIAVTDVEEGGQGKDKFKGTKGDDLFAGLGGKDVIKGGKGNDILDGGAGRDRLDGGKGDDILIGGAGKDVLKGGKGADTFVFQFASDSTAKGKGRDTILDFKRKDGDKIDLSAIDPLNDTGTFEYIGKAKFSGEAGELRWQKKSGSTLITADIDGDGKADFSIALAKAMAMKEADFIL
jgi:Ca2+-binding RTX toxin-like protein